jgi:hypothetical protein
LRQKRLKYKFIETLESLFVGAVFFGRKGEERLVYATQLKLCGGRNGMGKHPTKIAQFGRRSLKAIEAIRLKECKKSES